jgi:hypothetical protein
VTRIRALTELEDEIAEWKDAAVAEARARRPKPATWEEIGRAAGLKKTSAQARWGVRKKPPEASEAENEPPRPSTDGSVDAAMEGLS